jgi:hypothetical protein
LRCRKPEINNYAFQRVNEFKCVGNIVTESSKIKSEIKNRITAGNTCCHAFMNLLKSTVVSQKSKLTVYRTVSRPAVMCGSDVWTFSKSD